MFFCSHLKLIHFLDDLAVARKSRTIVCVLCASLAQYARKSCAIALRRVQRGAKLCAIAHSFNTRTRAQNGWPAGRPTYDGCAPHNNCNDLYQAPIYRLVVPLSGRPGWLLSSSLFGFNIRQLKARVAVLQAPAAVLFVVQQLCLTLHSAATTSDSKVTAQLLPPSKRNALVCAFGT